MRDFERNFSRYFASNESILWEASVEVSLSLGVASRIVDFEAWKEVISVGAINLGVLISISTFLYAKRLFAYEYLVWKGFF